MVTIRYFRAWIVVAALLAVSAAHADPSPGTAYTAARERIQNDYRADRAACGELKGNTKDACRERAIRKEKIARAKIKGGDPDRTVDSETFAVAKASSDYEAGRWICEAKSGNDRDDCVTATEAVHAKALTDVGMNRASGEGRKDAAEGTRDANFRVAKERCGSLLSERLASCVASEDSLR